MKLSTCHPQRKHQARGMCKNCYDKWLKNNNPAYRQSQLSNTSLWARKNPEKWAAIQVRRLEKDRANPLVPRLKREARLKRCYGLTQVDYDKMFDAQNGGCALCFRKPGKTPLHVDHDHVSGKVRGLLCHQCNWYLGTIDADPKIIKRIIQYREESTC